MLRSLGPTGSKLLGGKNLLKMSSRNAAAKLGGPPEYYQFIMREHELAENLVEEHFTKDGKLLPEERLARAMKWNVRPADYKPMNDIMFDVGDYPDLPVESSRGKDPFYDWDDPHLRRNWGEPMFYFVDQYTYACNDTTPQLIDHPTRIKRMAILYGSIAALFLFCYYVLPYRFPVMAPKDYPESRPLDALEDGTASTLFTTLGKTNPKQREMTEVTNYTFEGKYQWDPSKYVVGHGHH